LYPHWHMCHNYTPVASYSAASKFDKINIAKIGLTAYPSGGF